MADLFDRFSGSSGALAGHTADSGDTWSDPDGYAHINGSGSAWGSGDPGTTASFPVSSWTPPGTDYGVSMMLGADQFIAGNENGIMVRLVGSPGSEDGYLCYSVGASGSTISVGFLRWIHGDTYTLLGTLQTVSAAAGDVLFYTVAGTGSTVTLTVYQNGSLVYTIGDTNAARITSAGRVGIRILNGGGAGSGDFVRTLWAGSTSGPSAGVSPSSATVHRNGTRALSATGGLTNEVLNWTAGSGSFSGSPGSSVTYTAPGSGTSDTATWTSADLPTHTAAASITLDEGGTLALTGPTSGLTGSASTNFTVTATSLSGSDTTTHAVSTGETPSPGFQAFSSGSSSHIFTFTPTANGTHSVSITDSLGAAISGSPIVYTSTEGGTLALSGPSSGTTGSASTNFTVSAVGLSASNTVTPHSDSGGTFSPSSQAFSSGFSSHTFTYTPSADGAHAISITDTLGATLSGSPVAYTSSTPTPTPSPRRHRGGPAAAARKAAYIAGLRAQQLPAPDRAPAVKLTPTPTPPARPIPPAPPERPAINDSKPSKAKLDFPIRPRG
jgi:hypothetical protein